MDLSRHNALALRGSTAGLELARVAPPEAFPIGLFCAAPTILEAINIVLHEQGLAVLWTHADGTIGPPDPLLMRFEYVPSPFVC